MQLHQRALARGEPRAPAHLRERLERAADRVDESELTRADAAPHAALRDLLHLLDRELPPLGDALDEGAVDRLHGRLHRRELRSREPLRRREEPGARPPLDRLARDPETAKQTLGVELPTDDADR